MNQKVLLVDDDRELVKLIKLHLNDFGFECILAHDSEQGLKLALCTEIDLVVLDLNLPGVGGYEICKRINKLKPNLPVLILSCRADESDKVLGLELGAYDYVTKPFSMRELTARIQALIRRAGADSVDKSTHDILYCGDLQIDFERRIVKRANEVIDLTATEYNLLTFLALRRGKPFSREQLLSEVWGYQYSGYEHTVNSHINRLRVKLEPDQANPRYVFTVRGVGYKFTEAD